MNEQINHKFCIVVVTNASSSKSPILYLAPFPPTTILIEWTPTTTPRSNLRGSPILVFYWSLLLTYLGLDPLKGVSKERSFKFWKEVPPLTKRNSFKRNFTMLVTSLLICKEGILSNEESIATTTIYSSSSRYPRSITRCNTNVHLIGIVEAIHLFPYFGLRNVL